MHAGPCGGRCSALREASLKADSEDTAPGAMASGTPAPWRLLSAANLEAPGYYLIKVGGIFLP